MRATIEFISMKDPHFAFGFSNRIRYDYENDVDKKILFTRNYLVEKNIHDVVMTGDIIDSSYEDKWSFKKYRVNKRRFQSWADVATLRSNVGNHDYFHGFENTENTIFGELVDEEIISNLTKAPVIQDYADHALIIQGIDYGFSKEQVEVHLSELNNKFCEIPNYTTFKVAVMHSNVTPKEVEHITDFTYKYLAETYPDIDVFICGHYHLGYKTVTAAREGGKNVTFVNNWNFTRVVRDYEVEMDDHTPEFEHIKIDWSETEKRFIFLCGTIKVPHKPYDETFRAKEVSLLRKTNAEKFNFFDEINIETLLADQDLSDEEHIKLLNSKRTEKGYMPFSTEVLNKAIEYLNN